MAVVDYSQICFLEWRVEHLEATLQDERLLAQAQQQDLSEAIQAKERADARILELENQFRADHQAATRRLNITRERLQRLEATHQRFFQRLLAWQQLIHNGELEHLDLAEFIAELRSEIMFLNAELRAREAHEDQLLEQLALSRPPAISLKTRTATQQSKPEDLHSELGPQLEADAHFALQQINESSLKSHALFLWEQAKTNTGEVRRSALKTLTALHQEAAEPALIWALSQDPSDEDQIFLLELLGQMKSPKARPIFAHAARHETPAVRISALRASLRLNDDNTDEIRRLISQGLADKDPHVRRQTVLAALALPRFDPSPVFAPFASNPDPELRQLLKPYFVKSPILCRAPKQPVSWDRSIPEGSQAAC